MTNATKETLGLSEAERQLVRRVFADDLPYTEREGMILSEDMVSRLIRAARANPLSEGIEGSHGLMASVAPAPSPADHEAVEALGDLLSWVMQANPAEFIAWLFTKQTPGFETGNPADYFARYSAVLDRAHTALASPAPPRRTPPPSDGIQGERS